jgi:hypothetical protein
MIGLTILRSPCTGVKVQPGKIAFNHELGFTIVYAVDKHQHCHY